MLYRAQPHGVIAISSLVLVVISCSAADDEEGSLVSSASSASSGAGTSTSSGSGGASSSSSSTTSGAGGFDPGADGGLGGSATCSNTLTATIRDFSQQHPDFQAYVGDNAYPGIVQSDLGADGKPVYAHPGPTEQTSGPGQFAQWYNDVSGVNFTFQVSLPLSETSPGSYSYQSNAFFPIDGQGFGNEGNPNNFHFTTEIHTTFTYAGGEVFTFTGDDDLWLFINGKLAIDLGGLHPELTDTVNLDASAGQLGISPGNDYRMDIFHAERRTSESNFRVDTTIGCFQPPPT